MFLNHYINTNKYITPKNTNKHITFENDKLWIVYNLTRYTV